MLVKSAPTKKDILSYFESPITFATSGHVWIDDKAKKKWVRWEPWPCQLRTLNMLHKHPKTAILKARQLGLTTTAYVFCLWQFRFDPIAAIAIFSIGGREAGEVLLRFKGSYNRLPQVLQAKRITKDDSTKKIFQICAPDGQDEGSIITSLPSTAGESLTLSTIVFDEAGRSPGYDDLISRVMPTIKDSITAGYGRVVALGIFDKENPNKVFRRQLMDGKHDRNGWRTLFFPWYSRPDRSQDWFDETKQEMLEQHGTDDKRKQQYPETMEEALSPPESNRRVPYRHLSICSDNAIPVTDDDIPSIPGLVVFKMPEVGRRYVAAADCAEGLVASDESVTDIADAETGEQVAILGGRFAPDVHAGYSRTVCEYYNHAPILPERNNHGHAFITEFKNANAEAVGNGKKKIKILKGTDGKTGWNTTSAQQKIYMYDLFCQQLSDAAKEKRVYIHDEETRTQLESISSKTLKCPVGDEFFDDRAMARVLSACAIKQNAPAVSSKTI